MSADEFENDQNEPAACPRWAHEEMQRMDDKIKELTQDVTTLAKTNQLLNEQQKLRNIVKYDKESLDRFRQQEERQPMISFPDEITGNTELMLTNKMIGMTDPSRRFAQTQLGGVLRDRAGTDSIVQPYDEHLDRYGKAVTARLPIEKLVDYQELLADIKVTGKKQKFARLKEIYDDMQRGVVIPMPTIIEFQFLLAAVCRIDIQRVLGEKALLYLQHFCETRWPECPNEIRDLLEVIKRVLAEIRD